MNRPVLVKNKKTNYFYLRIELEHGGITIMVGYYDLISRAVKQADYLSDESLLGHPDKWFVKPEFWRYEDTDILYPINNYR
jgi:hypothetical protein